MAAPAASADAGTVRAGTARGRAVVAAAVLGSGMTMLDGTVVNVALRTIGADLHASLAELQWVSNGYLLSLASLILLGGSLGDRYGRVRMFVVGTLAFTLASVLCGLAPTPGVLIAARVLQGAGAAVLMPGSLAMIQGAFERESRAAAIGAWSGLGGIAAAVGPFLGGALVEYADWRWIFVVNVPLGLVTVLVARRWVPETLDPDAPTHFDAPGAALACVALGATTYALIEWGAPLAPYAVAVAALAGAAFVVVERRSRRPMLPLGIFGDRTFTSANVMTLLVYAALGAVLFFLVLELQTVAGYGPLRAGVSTLPITVCMLLLAARGGRLASRIGPRVPMTLGPLVMAAGVLLLLRVGPDTRYVTDVLPGITVFGLGLPLLVAPLTATVLASAPDEHAGLASGVNNAVARAGTLLAVAALPLAVGLTGRQYAVPSAFDAGFRQALVVCAVLLVLGGLLACATIRTPGGLGRSVPRRRR
ncbi:MAG: MFS transporter [Nocardioides sp.]